MRWLALVVVLSLPLNARADDGGLDAGAALDAGFDLPDASVDQGNAQMGSEEGEAKVVCQTDADCDHGSACSNHACVYRPPRDATQEGCSTAGAWLSGPLAVLVVRRYRFGLSKRTK
jgi:hypothetical protein